MFCWHKWPKWQDTEIQGKPPGSFGQIVPAHREPGDNPRAIKGYYKMQSRRCEKCNKLQLRTAKTK